MKLAVRFEEQEQRIDCDFGEVHEIADAEGYGKGYNDGKKDGYAEGYGEGESAGYSNGYEIGYENGAAESPAAAQLDALIDGSITEISSNSEEVSDHAVYNRKALTKADFPSAVSIEQYAFYGCASLSNISFPSAVSIGQYAFYGCVSLSNISFPSVEKIDASAFYSCSGILTAKFSSLKSIASNAFRLNSKLKALILRSNVLCTLGSMYAIQNTPIASGAGYIYVPSALVDSYKTATNWATYANQIRAIEDYPEICGEVTA